MKITPIDRFWTAPTAPAPADTDAQLWSVLTSPERTFFSRTVARSVTYGPSGAAGAPASRGQALDVRA